MKTTLAIFTTIAGFIFFFAQIQTLSSAASPPSKVLLPEDVVIYFTGDWTGKGKFTSGKDVESELSFTPDLGNQCLLVREKEKDPNTFQFIALWSMDTVSGDAVLLLTSNHDSGARLFRSHGWHVGKITFQSAPELRASWALERFTFERQSPTVFHGTYSMSMDGGKTWTVGDQQTFTKK